MPLDSSTQTPTDQAQPLLKEIEVPWCSCTFLSRCDEELLPTSNPSIRLCNRCQRPVHPDKVQSVAELVTDIVSEAHSLQKNVLRLLDNRQRLADIAHDVLAIMSINLERGTIVCKDPTCNDELRGYIKTYKERLSKLVVKPGRVFLDVESLKRADFS